MVVDAGTVDPEGIVLLGHRPPESDEDVDAELRRMPAQLAKLAAPAIREAGPEETGRDWAARLGTRGPAWLHLDLDVLDSEAMPAVSYPQPYGLTWEELEGLLAPLMSHPSLVGLSVADLEADLDPEGEYARRTIGVIAGTMA
jgi:arginase